MSSSSWLIVGANRGFDDALAARLADRPGAIFLATAWNPTKAAEPQARGHQPGQGETHRIHPPASAPSS
ncbi:hypothetical protein HDU86_008096 [Geranomyces michiganensis]|nr:hypothetical protein HDU86_008096 [Geranomyces michiganensis]